MYYISYSSVRFLLLMMCVTLSVLILNLLTSNNAHANAKYASLVIDADTGVVLHQENAGKKRFPASLVKMMTLYITFQAIEQGKLNLNQKIKVSSRAASQPPSNLRLRRGNRIRVKDAMLALIVKSANDAAVVLSEAIAGSEWKFAIMMNRMASKLGMNNTNFINSTGLHNRRQQTTAYDMARLAVALRRDYPRMYHLFDRTKFVYNGKVYKTHNRVTKTYPGADGLKTGYIRAAGYNLITSARRGGRSVVGVVLGGKNPKRRDRHMVKLLDRAFYRMAKGRVDNGDIMYTGAIPLPQLKPRTKSQARLNSAPIPSLKPRIKMKINSVNVDRYNADSQIVPYS